MSSLDIPQVNFSGLDLSKVGTEEWLLARGQVMKALETHGFFSAVFNKVPDETLDALFGPLADDLFSLPLETKMLTTSDKFYQGYIPKRPGSNFESLNIDMWDDVEFRKRSFGAGDDGEEDGGGGSWAWRSTLMSLWVKSTGAAWSNGRLKATPHRVKMGSNNETRRSIGFGSAFKDECKIHAPEDLVTEDHPLLYKPYHYDAYVQFRFSDAAKGSACPLKAYCGVLRGDEMVA
ncbi:hypothetical protein J5N97_015731 [Dioscorea zingiberensis]|uniref:Non-haem dioxygenase N-terminal domain-containing protein n=1 Tax=Dioscorea zingiberensis TaxID=325984 RepID=A0A9D5CID7_9LILI|nr:hypothetical protein J5N97_015731 [Dioscorea zingiberensis]